jgi:hypothetical protein
MRGLEEMKSEVKRLDALKEPVSRESVHSTSVEQDAAEFQAKMQERIEQEVNRRRAEGKYPPSFEAKLRSLYSELVPKGQGASEKDLRHLIYSVDRSAIVDIDVPLQSQKPGVTHLKTVLRKLMAWYLNYLAQQLSNFHANLIQLLHAYDLRLSRLERRESTVTIKHSRVELDLDGRQLEKCLEVVGSTSRRGRTLVTSCGSSELLTQLAGSGREVYGIDHDPSGLDQLAERGYDVRWDETLRHLEHVRPRTLDAVVLQGSDEVSETNDKVSTIQRIFEILRPEGTVAVVVHDPSMLANNESLAITLDLSSGKLFQPVTWRHLLQEVGFEGVEIVSLPRVSARKAGVSLVVGYKGAE